MRRYVGRAALLAALCGAAAVARAHAPLARDLALAPEGGALAVRMPGFGLLVRSGEQAPFAYACDALLGVQPHEALLPMVYAGDGALLLGTEAGLRIVTPDGCPLEPAETDLPPAPIAALAVHALDRSLVYAATSGSDAAVYRSRDGGVHWELRSSLAEGQVTAMRVAPDDPDVIYVSRTTGAMLSSIEVSADAGATFSAHEQALALVLLHVEPGEGGRLWAMARSGGVRGVDILWAERAEGPWTAVLHVNFFGGFAAEPDTGVIWVGDEGGSVFRSTDGGDSFEDAEPDTAVACLVEDRGTLWACTPGTSAQRALATLPQAGTGFEDVIAFADVDRMVDCAPAIDVAEVCAPAWNEWRVDVQAASASAQAPDAGSPDDAGPEAAADAGPLQAIDAGGASEDLPPGAPGPGERPPSTCAASGTAGSAPSPANVMLGSVLVLLAALSRRRRCASC